MTNPFDCLSAIKILSLTVIGHADTIVKKKPCRLSSLIIDVQCTSVIVLLTLGVLSGGFNVKQNSGARTKYLQHKYLEFNLHENVLIFILY